LIAFDLSWTNRDGHREGLVSTSFASVASRLLATSRSVQIEFLYKKMLFRSK